MLGEDYEAPSFPVRDPSVHLKVLILTRQEKAWGLAPHKNIVIYRGGETRGASLGPNTSGGKAILTRYGI
jgi:hypothetical protein